MSDSQTTQEEDQEPSRAELSVLLNTLLDETISAEQMARLDGLLVCDAECRRAYREIIGLHVALQFSFQEAEAAEEQPVVAATELPPPLPSGGKAQSGLGRWRGVAASAAAAVLLVGLLAWQAVPLGLSTGNKTLATQDRSRATDRQSLAADAPIAVLQSSSTCSWAGNRDGLVSGCALSAGRTLDLLEGTATLHYENGINLVLEGPARLTLLSPTHAKLDCGKCLTSVPLPNKGFRISTPSAEVIDQGTEFGVAVSEKGYSEVGVFKGQVECFAVDHSRVCVDRVRLLAGQVARVDAKAAQTVSANLDTLKSSFPAPVPVTSSSAIYSYWRFEEEPPAPTDDGLSTQLNVISDSSGNGRRLDFWPGGKAGVGRYRFSNDVPPARMFRTGFGGGRHSFDCGALSPDAPGVAIAPDDYGTAEAIANGFTVEGFFKTAGDLSTARPMTLLYQGEKYYSYLIGLNKSGPGTFTFFVYGSANAKTVMPEIALKGKNFADGKWHYFAARYEVDPTTRQGRLRADVVDENGRRFAGELDVPDGFRIACSSRPLLLGRQQYFAHEEPKAHFHGLIDELRIASRPLRDDELLARLPAQ